jgi:hypothetical protein
MDTTTADAAPMLNSRELARRWGLSPHTLENWRAMGRGPAFQLLSSNGEQGGRFVRYRLEDVVDFERRFERYAPKAPE